MEKRQNPLLLTREVPRAPVWALTWAPDPSLYRSTDPLSQWKTCMTYLQIARRFSKDFMFCPELTNSGNVHIHGYYVIDDGIKYFKKFLPTIKKYGFVYIKPIDDMDIWLAYMTKEQDFMQNYFEGKCLHNFTSEHNYCVCDCKPKHTFCKFKKKNLKTKIPDYFK